jgi:hypothetical protein
LNAIDWIPALNNTTKTTTNRVCASSNKRKALVVNGFGGRSYCENSGGANGGICLAQKPKQNTNNKIADMERVRHDDERESSDERKPRAEYGDGVNGFATTSEDKRTAPLDGR